LSSPRTAARDAGDHCEGVAAALNYQLLQVSGVAGMSPLRGFRRMPRVFLETGRSDSSDACLVCVIRDA